MGDINWQDEFQKMALNDSSLSQQSSQHDLKFQHRLNEHDDKNNEINFHHRLNEHDDKNNGYPTFESPVTLRYRDSVSSNASSLSRNSTISSTDTRYYSVSGPPGTPQSPTTTWGNLPPPLTLSPNRIERPSSLSPLHGQFQQQIPFNTEQQQYSIVEPTGCFVPSKPLPFIQKNEVTRHHYVIPSFAMAGESQAEVMKLIFNQTDNASFKPKEEYERTVPWHIDGNSSLVTLSQHTSLGQENPVTRNYLLGLGQRLGITTIIVTVSIEVIGTVYPLLDNLVKAMEISNTSNLLRQDQPTWWSRVVIIINQQHGVSDHAAYNQRKEILTNEMPRIQERYRLSQPLSVLFLSTQVHDKLINTSQAFHYKSCCQRILWQMMEKHMLSGRWSSEFITLQNRVDSNMNGGSLLNVLNEDDESSSSSDDALFKTVIDYVDGKKRKPVKKRNPPPIPLDHITPAPSTLQRRATRREIQIQKLHSHDGDNGTSLPLPIKHI